MLLRTLQAQGLPDVVSVIAPGYPIDPKTRPGILKSLLSFMQYFAPEQSRVFDLEVGSDRLSALRMLSEGKPGDVRWREGRAWLLGERVEWEETSGEGTLKVTGVVRGAQLSSNRLVHLPNYGDFQISRVSRFRHVFSTGSLEGQLILKIIILEDRVCTLTPPVEGPRYYDGRRAQPFG